MSHYRDLWWYPDETLATNARAAVFPEGSNVYASIFSDAGLTIPLANPTTTDGSAFLDFYATDGDYRIWVGPTNGGDGTLVTVGPVTSGTVISVNGQTGVVVLTAADVGADPAGSAAAAAAASQPLATIDAKGDLYAGTANDTTTRLAVGTNNQVLRANSATGTGLEYATLSASDVGAVPTTRLISTTNGLTGGGDLSADRTLQPTYGSSANTVAQGNDTRIVNAIQGTIVDAKGDVITATANDTPARLAIGTDGQVLTAASGQATGLQWATPASAPVTSVNGQTGVVVLTAANVGALAIANNLSDVANVGTSRTNLGLGGAATLNVGTTAGTVAAGDDSRITGAQQRSTLTAKGDLYVATASAVTARQAVGTDGQYLRAASGQTNGIEYHTIVASDVGAVPTTRLITTTNGITGGGDLSADRTFQPVYGTSANTVAQGNDTRIVNALQQTLLDAKGDIIAATANDTPARLAVGTDNQVLIASSGASTGVAWANRQSETLIFYDDRATLTVVAGDARWYNRQQATTIVGVWASAGVVPTGADIIVDVNVNGSTIFSTQANRPTVPATTNGGTLSATPNTTTLALGDYITVDIDQIGSTIAGGRLTVGIVVRPT